MREEGAALIGVAKLGQRYPPTRAFTLVDLFCGAGGFTEGFLLAGSPGCGFELAAASDVSPMVRLTYEGRYREQLGLPFEFLMADVRDSSFIRKLTLSVKRRTGGQRVDVVCGGPPCQGFSVFGRRDESDPRNDLFRPYLRAIEVLQPRYFVMENVPGLVRMYGGSAVDRIRDAVERMRPVRYHLAGPISVNAADFGVPQLRDRVLFIGSRSDMPALTSLERGESHEYVTVGEAIGDLAFLRPWESATEYREDWQPTTSYQKESRLGRLFAKYGLSPDGSLWNHEAAKHTPEVLARFGMLEKGRGLDSIPRPLWDRYLKTSKKWSVRLDDAKPSYTVVTLADDLVHPTHPRVLTVRELARLQSFDDTFVFRGPRSTGGGGAGNRKRTVEVPQYSQVGNAVPPLLAQGIAAAVLECLVEVDNSPKPGRASTAPSSRRSSKGAATRGIHQFVHRSGGS